MAHPAPDLSTDAGRVAGDARRWRDDARQPAGDRVLVESLVLADETPAADDEPTASDRLARLLGRFVSPWLTSLIFHLSLLLILALIVLRDDPLAAYPGLIVSRDPQPQLDRLHGLELPTEATLEMPSAAAVEQQAIRSAEIALQESFADARAPATAAPLAPLLRGNLMTPVGPRGGGLQGRAPKARGQLVARRGGNAASENAVALGLAWLADHQLDDGSWRLNHHLAPSCPGLCTHPGNVGSTTAATGLALLPFLGAGSTHEQGPYRDVVRRGIYYLGSRMRLTPQGGDLQEGTMYAQGLASIALCEAYAMTGDPALREYCEAAIEFIVSAQHGGGGWRYMPGQAGDTTSFGWQLMALKSGRLGDLRVPSPTLSLASEFLDSVQADGGAHYGYQAPDDAPTTTAIGLLCRMYLGWPREHEALGRGVRFLSEQGPSPTNLYYNYYATQVMCHYDNAYWEPWNAALRDHLIATQATEGHERGSWWFEDAKTHSAGRLYNTAMAVMILEVYYRHMPLYQPLGE